VGVARAETVALAREAITRGLRGDLALDVLDAAAAAVDGADEATLTRAGVELAAALVAAAATAAVRTRGE